MLTVPEWVCTLVGRAVLDAEALRQENARLSAERDDLLHRADHEPTPARSGG